MSLSDSLCCDKIFNEGCLSPVLPETYDQLKQKINLEIDRLQIKMSINVCNGHGDENEYLEYQAQALNDSIVLLASTQIKQFNVKEIIQDFNSFRSNYFKDDIIITNYYKEGLIFVIKLLQDL